MADKKCKWREKKMLPHECYSCLNLRQRAEKRFTLDADTPVEKAEHHIHFTKNSPVHAYTNRLLQDLIDIIAEQEGENGKS